MTISLLTTQTANAKANPAQKTIDTMWVKAKKSKQEKAIDLLVGFHGWCLFTTDKSLAYKEVSGVKFVAIFDIPHAISLSVFADSKHIADFVSENYTAVALALEVNQSAKNYGA